jgi:hypothetical protein
MQGTQALYSIATRKKPQRRDHRARRLGRDPPCDLIDAMRKSYHEANGARCADANWVCVGSPMRLVTMPADDPVEMRGSDGAAHKYIPSAQAVRRLGKSRSSVNVAARAY